MTTDRVLVARAVADAVTALPQVAALTSNALPGHGVEVATLLPGGKIRGVHADDETVHVHIVAAEFPLPPVIAAATAAAEAALRERGDTRQVEIFVAEVTDSALARLAAPKLVDA